MSRSAASRRAATPAGQPPASADNVVSMARMSARSSGARRFGGVARIRRIPDSAADDFVAAGRVEAGGGVHLVDRRHPAGQRGRGVPPFPDAGLLGGGLGDVVRQHGGGRAGSGGNRRRPAQAANRSQSERYAIFVAAAVEASTAASTRASASAGSCRTGSTTGTGRARAAAARSASRRNCSLGSTRGAAGTCGAADDASSAGCGPGDAAGGSATAAADAGRYEDARYF